MGLIDLLAGRTTLRQALQEVAVPTHGFDNSMASLRLLSSGNVAEDPGSFSRRRPWLGSWRSREALRHRAHRRTSGPSDHRRARRC